MPRLIDKEVGYVVTEVCRRGHSSSINEYTTLLSQHYGTQVPSTGGHPKLGLKPNIRDNDRRQGRLLRRTPSIPLIPQCHVTSMRVVAIALLM